MIHFCEQYGGLENMRKNSINTSNRDQTQEKSSKCEKYGYCDNSGFYPSSFWIKYYVQEGIIFDTFLMSELQIIY